MMRKAFQRLGLAVALGVALPLQANEPSADAAPPWSLAWSAQAGNKLPVRGVVDLDRKGSPVGGMVYPAPNLVGFLAAVLTHAAINDGVQRSQRLAMEEQANKVLDPFRPLLDGYSPDQLLGDVRQLLAERNLALAAGGLNPASVELQVQPLLWMTQDRQALILDLAVKERPIGKAAKEALGMRMVSAPVAVDQLPLYWLDREGLALRQTIANLMSDAIQHLIAEIKGQKTASASPQRTVRYFEGGVERIERAQVLEQKCGRALLRTLRGELLSVPWHHGCPAPELAVPSSPAAQASSAPGT